MIFARRFPPSGKRIRSAREKRWVHELACRPRGARDDGEESAFNGADGRYRGLAQAASSRMNGGNREGCPIGQAGCPMAAGNAFLISGYADRLRGFLQPEVETLERLVNQELSECKPLAY
jgi:hypothetical protein